MTSYANMADMQHIFACTKVGVSDFDDFLCLIICIRAQESRIFPYLTIINDILVPIWPTHLPWLTFNDDSMVIKAHIMSNDSYVIIYGEVSTTQELLGYLSLSRWCYAGFRCPWSK